MLAASTRRRVRAVMADGRWRSGYELARIVGGADSAVTARLRDLRKAKYGGHEVRCDRFPDGVYRYRLVLA